MKMPPAFFDRGCNRHAANTSRTTSPSHSATEAIKSSNRLLNSRLGIKTARRIELRRAVSRLWPTTFGERLVLTTKFKRGKGLHRPQFDPLGSPASGPTQEPALANPQRRWAPDDGSIRYRAEVRSSAVGNCKTVTTTTLFTTPNSACGAGTDDAGGAGAIILPSMLRCAGRPRQRFVMPLIPINRITNHRWYHLVNQVEQLAKIGHRAGRRQQQDRKRHRCNF